MMPSNRYLIAIATLIVAALLAWVWVNRYAAETDVDAVIDAATADRRARAGEIVLVDIRRPSEWQATGVPASGYAVTMHQDTAKFMAALRRLAGDPAKPIALICATGGRTGWLQPRLEKEGFANVINVAEGMKGSRFGAGWLQRGLAVRRWLGPQSRAPR